MHGLRLDLIALVVAACVGPVSGAVKGSRGRISRDKDDAGRILGILDKVVGIEAGSQLADLLRLLNPGTELHSVDDEDVPMYRSRTSGACICSRSTMDAPQHAFVLASRRDNPTRLKGADEILAKAAEDRRNGHSDAIAEDGETTSPDAETDMLVKCLHDSIARALEKVQEMAQRGPSCVINHETNAAARKIESAEQASMQEWIENHSVLDEDGRARCSLHFCHKLFKDRAFLLKHLLKKHSNQLRAECAKCHDDQ
jgi:hypothetical protein